MVETGSENSWYLKKPSESYIWANYNDQTAEVTLNGGLVRESPPKSP